MYCDTASLRFFPPPGSVTGMVERFVWVRYNPSHPSSIRNDFKLSSLHFDTPAIGAILIIVGAIVQTFTKGGDPMLAGRFVVGLGASFEAIGEFSHPPGRILDLL